MSTTTFPDTLTVRPHSIPAILRERLQWVAWCWEWRDSMNDTGGKWTKVPIDVRTGRHAQSDNPDTWADFDTAHAYAETRTNIAGIGYVFSPDDPFAGIDFDDCRDEATGGLDAWAAAMLAGFDSYAEVSPSGTGVKCIVHATLPGGGIRRQRPKGIPGGMVEMYDRGRFFTLTGHHVPTTPATVHDAQGGATTLYARLTQRTESPAKVTSNGHHGGQVACNPLSDEGLIALASRSQSGPKFSALWMGGMSGYASHSEADMALCSLLAFYTGTDTARIDRLFRRSLLMRPKWDERHGAETYGALTVRKAIAGRTEFWQPGGGYAARTDGPDIAPAAATSTATEVWRPPANPWPEPLAEEAYHGLAGEIVCTIEPHTESDPAAILFQLLVALGNCIGRSPHFMAEADRHSLNLYLALVGETAKGRKGTSWGRVRSTFNQIDPAWLGRVVDGLSSGEGLIEEVRDPRTDPKDGTVIEAGAADKRLMVLAPEFAAVLQVQRREGSTLPSVLRNAWDGNTLRVMTRKNPLTATGAHISLVGHITRDELLRNVDDTSATNGYLNRFLFAAVRRSKYLPFGGSLDEERLFPLLQQLSEVVTFARTTGEMRRDADADALWEEVYPDLTEPPPGLVGAIMGRAEPIVMRLACLYALLDLSAVVRPPHLLAALAVWAHSAQSVKWIFGDRLGDPVADELLRVLRASPDGMTRTEINNHFGGHRQASRITLALRMLEQRNLARCEREETGGRPVERWHLMRRAD